MCVILSSIHREKSVDGTPERDMYYISPVFIFAYYPHYRDVSVVLCISHTTNTQNGSTLDNDVKYSLSLLYPPAPPLIVVLFTSHPSISLGIGLPSEQF